MAITHVTYTDTFVMIRRQFTRIGRYCGVKGKRADLFSTAVHVLDMERKYQIILLQNQGVSEEDLTEEMLGFALTWRQFADLANHHYCERSFEEIIKEVVKAKVARRYYVECHRERGGYNGREALTLVRDEAGQLRLYKTLEEAQDSRLEGGEIVNYFFFDPGEVNDLTAKVYNLPRPPDSGPGSRKNGHKNGGAQHVSSADGHVEQPPAEMKTSAQVGNFTTDFSISGEMISQGSQNCEGLSTESYQNSQNSQEVEKGSQKNRGGGADGNQGSQNCTATPRKFAGQGSQNCEGNPRKFASNKNSNKETIESTEEVITNGASGAIALALSQFDFSQPITTEAIDQLARLCYPLMKEAALAHATTSARTLAESGVVARIGLRALAANMLYHVDESSPCRWRPWCRDTYKKPKLAMRPWQLESETVLWKMHQEREEAAWWPDILPSPTGLVEVPPEIDLADLAGIDQYERVGMDGELAAQLVDGLADMFARLNYPYEAKHQRVSPLDDRGYAIEVWYERDGTRRVIRFYDAYDWDLIVDAQEQTTWGSLEFVRYLREAVRREVA